MKYYYTIIQEYTSDKSVALWNYLDRQEIKYRVGADYIGELVRLGRIPAKMLLLDSTALYSKYVILTEEENLSIIKLRVNDIHIIKDSLSTRINNFVRSRLKWFFN